MTPINLTGLRSQEYEHPDDGAALEALRNTGGLETVATALSAASVERMLRIQTTGSYLRVTADSIPELYSLFTSARERLSLTYVPELYIGSGESINAFTAGVKHPIIVINSGTVDHLTDDELLFVIAHEMGHIKSGHVLYYQMASLIPVIGSIVGDLTFNIGKLLSMGLEYALLHWQRTSELTADRAGLLACQNAETAFRAMMKLAGLPRKYTASTNVEDFLQQAREFQSLDSSTIDKVAKYLSISGVTHPWTVMRAKELLNWIETRGYERVLKAPRSALPPPSTFVRRFCDNCGTPATATVRFCDNCQQPLPPPGPATI